MMAGSARATPAAHSISGHDYSAGFLFATALRTARCTNTRLKTDDAELTRVVFALTTIPSRVEMIEPVVSALLGDRQTRPADTVYLAIPPSIEQLPSWLNMLLVRPESNLRVLHMKADYGPASKVLAAVADGGETGRDTLLVYGDDDILYPPTILEQHLEAHRTAAPKTAFGTRRISVGEGARQQALLEATGTISLRASDVPAVGSAVFAIGDAAVDPSTAGTADACRLSDDFWVAHHLSLDGLRFELLPGCEYNFRRGVWPRSCGEPFEPVDSIGRIDALSQSRLHANGKLRERRGGDWREQLNRYVSCQRLLLDGPDAHSDLR